MVVTRGIGPANKEDPRFATRRCERCGLAGSALDMHRPECLEKRTSPMVKEVMEMFGPLLIAVSRQNRGSGKYGFEHRLCTRWRAEVLTRENFERGKNWPSRWYGGPSWHLCRLIPKSMAVLMSCSDRILVVLYASNRPYEILQLYALSPGSCSRLHLKTRSPN